MFNCIRNAQAAFAGAVVVIGAMALRAPAQAIYTTQSDFTGWTNYDSPTVQSIGPSGAYDFDGSTTNGLGNYSAGGAGLAGSLQVNVGTGTTLGYADLGEDSYNELYLSGFLNAIDPGASAGSTTPYNGTIYMVYTVPGLVGPNAYFGLGLGLTYPGDGYNQYSNGGPYFGGSAYDGLIDGLPTYTETIPYSILAGGGGGFNIHLIMSAGVYGSGVNGVDNVTTTPYFYVDDISTTLPVAVPEPATLGVMGAGVTLLTLRRRIRKATSA
jgi:hypothetical protein